MAQKVNIAALKIDQDAKTYLLELENDLRTLRTAFLAVEAAVNTNKAAMGSYATPASVALVTSNFAK
jgi:hypothetical protein